MPKPKNLVLIRESKTFMVNALQMNLEKEEYKVTAIGPTIEELNEVKEKIDDTDYFETFDYILGDYSYDKLRLKGFYKKNNKKATEINSYEKITEYIKDYCSYGCRYFILEKVAETDKK